MIHGLDVFKSPEPDPVDVLQWFPGFIEYVLQPHMIVIACVIIGVFTVVLSVLYFVRRWTARVAAEKASASASVRPRFRKRDKMMFYGRKIIRKVRLLSLQAAGGKARIKRTNVVRLAKRLLRLKREQPLTLQVKGPSDAFLEEDIRDDSEHRLPPEVVYMLKSIRVFGFFEKPLFLELCKHIESAHVPAGHLLFSIGEPDDSIYVVQSGRLLVYITETDGTTLPLKEVPPGESIASLLSIMDVLMGNAAAYKTVSAHALEDSTVLRLKVEAFRTMLQKYPESLVRVCQIIMVRLQRVTFTALRTYLGLSTQLIRSASSGRKTQPPPSPKSSPSRPISRRTSQYGRDPEKISPLSSMTEPVTIGKTVTFKKIGGEREDNIQEITADVPENDFSAPTQKPPVAEKAPPSPQKQFSQTDSTSEDFGALRKKRISLSLDEKNLNLLDGLMLRQIAVDGFMSHLGIKDGSLIKDKVVVKDFPIGEYLTREAAQDVSLYYPLSGSLTVSQKALDTDEEQTLFIAHAGELVGALAVLTGEPSIFTIKTRHQSIVGILSVKDVFEILRQQPPVVLHLANTVIKRLSPFVRQIDFALDWLHIESGRALYRQGDTSDCMYIVLSGRLRAVLTRDDGKKELVGEYGRGDLVGIVELLTITKRSTTLMAVRDTELAKLPEGLLNAIKIKYPVVVTRLIQLLGRRILGSLQKGDSFNAERAMYMGSRPSGSNFATVAILPVSDDVPLSAFTLELNHALTKVGPTLRLTSDIIKKTLGPSVLESANEYRLCSWLGQQEDHHRLLLYQCDSNLSAWTRRCIRQADCILIVALADQEPTVGEVEKQLEHVAVRTQKELILLWRDSGSKPRNTVQWLNVRSWCSTHHHMRCPKRMFTKKSPAKMMEFYDTIFQTHPNIHSDFTRLARFLTGTSIALVLGGGGARGAAHVGMIRAIVEAGIPIDMVGGVSIGAFMGALWCQEKDLTTFIQKAREWSLKMTSVWRQILDLTYPVTAMFTGAAFNRAISEVFGDRNVEDLWLPYFTVTTDITESTMRIHTHGSLWRYIRSSMSLSGYMPPMCDPTDGHLLLDGGYVNNLPADIMREMGAETIIAVDVGSQDETDLTNYGDTLNGWWLLWKRWNPWAAPVKVPSLPEIQSRLAYVSCVRQLEQVKRSNYCTYVRPPIDKYKTLQFGSFDEIMDIGYAHGKTLFEAMKHGQRSLTSLLQEKKTKPHPQVVSLASASFTDLAEMVCQIKPPVMAIPSDESDDDDYDELDDREAGYVSEPEINYNDIDQDYHSSPKLRAKLDTLSDIECTEDGEEL